MPDAAPQPAAIPAHSLASVARGVVQLLRRHAGRGPTQIKALWAGEDAILVLLSGGYTRAETTLAQHGREVAAVEYRQAVFRTLEADLRAIVEEAMARSVRAVMTCARHDPGVMALVFLLEPLGGNGSAEAGRWGAGIMPASHTAPDGAAGPPG